MERRKARARRSARCRTRKVRRQYAPFGAPPPFYWGGCWKGFLKACGKTRMPRRIARTKIYFPPPRSGGGGPREAWWRGPLRWSFVVGAERSSRPAPRPPRSARSPLPAIAGRDEAKGDPHADFVSARELQQTHHPRATPSARAARAALCRIYCDVMALWRSCATKRCKRHRRCCGKAAPCLERGRLGVPRGLHAKILAEVRAGGPARLAPINNVERQLRRDPPGWL